MSKGIKVTYYYDNSEMTDAEYEDQEESVLNISEKDVREFIESKVPKGQSIVWAESHYELKK